MRSNRNRTMTLLAMLALGSTTAAPATVSRAEAAEVAAPTKLTLERAMELADASNPDLAVAAERVAQAGADLRSAYAGFLPQVEAQASYLWYNREVVVPPPFPPIVLQKSPTYQGQVQGTLPLFNPSAFPVLSAARHGKIATEAAREAGRQELLYGVSQAFWGVVVSDRLVKAADEAVANGAELSRVSGEQYKAQVATQLAVFRARAAEEQARQFAISARGSRGSAEAALRRLTGIEGPIEVEPPATTAPTLTDDTALWASAKLRRPDLRSAEEAVKARAALKRGTVTSYLPVVAGQGKWFYTNNEGLTGRKDGGSLGFVASWPLFDGGLREAEASRTASRHREALAQNESALRRAREEVSRAALDLATAVASRDAAREGASFARQVQTLAETQYQAGTATNLELTQANAGLLQAEAAFAQAEAQAALAAFQVKKATGESLR